MNEVVKIIEDNENKSKRTLKDFLLDFFDIISFVVFILGVVSFIKFFLFNPFQVVGQSMEPTFHDKDFIIVDKITHRFGELKRGDVIVFVPAGKDVPYIKRIIGIPGDTVKIENGTVTRCTKDETGESCEKLVENYIKAGGTTNPCSGGKLTEFTVTPGGYLVFGDNRENSTDSRCCFGLECTSGNSYLVQNEQIIGKVYIKILPNIEKF
ncbi:MAG: signal peptidase I [Candidatus Absconditabacteria bacterium]